MAKVVELSSDSDDSIILPSASKFDDDSKIKQMVYKYISENYKESSSSHRKSSSSRSSCSPINKKLRKSQNSDNDQSSKAQQEALKQQKMLEKKQKKEEAEQNKQIKKVMQNLYKNSKPGECKKFITVIIDNNMYKEYSVNIIRALVDQNVQYEIQSQVFPSTITWKRQEPTFLTKNNGKVETNYKKESAEEMLMILSMKDFINHVHNNSLVEQIQNVKCVMPESKITLVVYGLQDYYKLLKGKKKRNSRQSLGDLPEVPTQMIEYRLTELQLLYSCSHRLIDTLSDLGQLVAQFTKAVAESQFKIMKNEKYQQNDWYIAGDNKDCVKVDKDGNGLNRLWKQVLTAFPLASLETAEAIAANYPSLSSLLKAYDNCASTAEGELLLQNIPIRRAAGPLSSTRKIGPELSKKIYTFFTSTDGDILL